MEKRVIPHLGILVTTYCNLDCRNCADLIPRRSRTHYDIEEIKNDLQNILSAVKYIEEVLVIGGEILMYPQLQEVLDFCSMQDQIGRLIVTTNGTMNPRQEILTCLKRNNVLVRISGYPQNVVPNRKEVVLTYLNHGIEIEDHDNMTWLNMGGTHRRNRSQQELKAVFNTCSMKDCVAIGRHGLIFFCSRQMSAYETDLYPTPADGEYINVREEGLEEKIESFYRLPYISTCDYCDGISCATSGTVPTAAQILKKESFLELLSIFNLWKQGPLSPEEKVQSVEAVCDILSDDLENLCGLASYQKMLLSLQEWLGGNMGESWDKLVDSCQGLLNTLTADYNFYVDAQLPFARTEELKNMPNLIKVGKFPDSSSDILVTEEDAFIAARKKYPLHAIEYNRLFIESRLESLKNQPVNCIVSGSSYAQYGILEKEMPLPTVNLSVTSQDTPYSILLVRRALEINETIEKIIIPITYYSAFYDMSGDDIKLHQDVMDGVNIPILNHSGNRRVSPSKEISQSSLLNIYDSIFDLERVREHLDNKVKSELADKEYFNGMNPRNPLGGLKFNFLNLSTDEKYQSGKITASLNEKVCTENGYLEVMKYLSSFLEDMYPLGKEILVFVPPMTKYLYEAYDKDLIELYYENLVTLLKQYNNVKFLDLANDSRFVDTDFCDYEHLSESGAIKLTQLLGAEVKEKSVP